MRLQGGESSGKKGIKKVRTEKREDVVVTLEVV